MLEDKGNLLDSRAVTFSWVDEGHLVPASFLTPLELSDCGLIPSPAHRGAGRELVLGAAGALLVHVLAAATFLLLPLLHPPKHTQGPFINVYFADAAPSACGPTGTGPVDGAGTGKQSARPLTEARPGEKEAAPDVPKAKIMRQAVSPAKTRRKPLARQKKGHASHHENLPDDSHKHAAAIMDHASKDSGTGSEKGRVKATGEGPGSPGPGNSSAGTGLSGEFDAASVDKAPQILKKTVPTYPERARSLGICGKVVVRFLVEPNGRIAKPSIVEAHPRGFFEQSTLEAIRHWQFKPGCFKGKDVAAWVILPVQFRLTEQD